jgi:hypothetical protein
LLLHCFAAKNLTIAEACSSHSTKVPLLVLLRHKRKSLGKIKKVNNFIKNCEEFIIKWQGYVPLPGLHVIEKKAEAAETAPISEVMKRSRLVVPEDVSDEGAPATKAEQVDAEEGESEDDYSALPSKPSHLEFGRSTVTEDDMPKLMKLGYFSEAKKKLIRFGGDEITPKPEKDEVVVFKSFFKEGLRFPLNKMIADVLEKFGIYLHQLLTPSLGLASTSGLSEARGQNRLLKASAGHMSFIIRQKLEKMVCTRTSAATILLIAKMRSLQLSTIVPNGQLAGRLNDFMSKLMRKRRSWFKAH